MVIDRVATMGAKGLGELLWDVCGFEQWKFTHTKSLKGEAFFSIPDKLARILPDGWQRFTNNRVIVHEGNEGQNAIYSSEYGRKIANFRECRRILLETVLPFWRVDKVKADSFQQWLNSRRKRPSASKWRDILLHGESGSLPLRDIR